LADNSPGAPPSPAMDAPSRGSQGARPPRLTFRMLRGWIGELELDDFERTVLEERRRVLEDAFYSEAIYALVRRWLTAPQARRLWEAVAAHQDTLRQRLGRNPGLQVACLDYLLNFEETPWDLGLAEREALDAQRGTVMRLTDRVAFLAVLDREINRARRYHRHLALDVIDIDALAQITTAHGPDAGEFVVDEVASVLESTVRSSDVPCRYRGEQFALVLPESNVQRAFLTAERVRRIVENRPFLVSTEHPAISVTLSAGVAEYPLHGRDAAGLLSSAEASLAQAKATGANRVCLPPPRSS